MFMIEAGIGFRGQADLKDSRPYILLLSGIILLSLLLLSVFKTPDRFIQGLAFAQAPKGSGSGFIIDPRGYILTAAHVVEGAEKRKIEVIVGGKDRHLASLLAQDKANDLALLRIEAQNLPFVRLGRSDRVELLEKVFVFGYPLGLQEVSAVSGQITAIRDPKGIDPSIQIKKLIETNARVNPGNSGGPLVNDRAEAIGVVVAKLIRFEGHGFAVPLEFAIPMLNKIPNLDHSNIGREGRPLPDPEIARRITPARGPDRDQG